MILGCVLILDAGLYGSGEGNLAEPLGLPFMRRRKSSFLFVVDVDARDISADLAAYVRSRYHARSVSVA